MYIINSLFIYFCDLYEIDSSTKYFLISIYFIKFIWNFVSNIIMTVESRNNVSGT